MAYDALIDSNKYITQMTAIADALRAASKTTGLIDVSNMPDMIKTLKVQEDTPLTFVAMEKDSAVTLTSIGEVDYSGIRYRTNGTDDWLVYTKDTVIDLSVIGEYVQFKNDNNILSIDESNYFSFLIKGTVAGQGNIMSMLNHAASCSNYCFFRLFAYNTGLLSAPSLPCMNLANYCYSELFRCTGIVVCPELPATVMKKGCYNNLFRECPSIEYPPVLPSTALADICYRGMFYKCVSLKEAPELPALVMAYGCYAWMFQLCTLIKSVTLPATTLASICYQNTLRGCVSLQYIKVGFTEWTTYNNTAATDNWLTDVGCCGSFVKPATLQIKHGASAIPVGWVASTDDNEFTEANYEYVVSDNSISDVNGLYYKYPVVSVYTGIDKDSVYTNGIYYLVKHNTSSLWVIVASLTKDPTGSNVIASIDTTTPDGLWSDGLTSVMAYSGQPNTSTALGTNMSKNYNITGELVSTVNAKGNNFVFNNVSATQQRIRIQYALDSVAVVNSTFSGDYGTSTAYIISVMEAKRILLKNLVFDETVLGKNPIELGLGSNHPPKEITIKNCEFRGSSTGKFINIFSYADNAIINIENCVINQCSSLMRLSNMNVSANCTINIRNCVIKSWGDSKYAGLILAQDMAGAEEAVYRNNSFGKNKLTINIVDCVGAYGIISPVEDMSTICGLDSPEQLMTIYSSYFDLAPYDEYMYPEINIIDTETVFEKFVPNETFSINNSSIDEVNGTYILLE